MRVPKVLTINAKTSTEFHITANGFEGFLKMPKERGIRYGWTKQYVLTGRLASSGPGGRGGGTGRSRAATPHAGLRVFAWICWHTHSRSVAYYGVWAETRKRLPRYVVVRDTRVYHVDKEKEKDKASDDALIADFK